MTIDAASRAGLKPAETNLDYVGCADNHEDIRV